MLKLLALLAAADPGSQVGQNLGNMLTGFAKPVYLGIVACVALVCLLSRKFIGLFVFMGGALLVGWLVFDSAGFGSFAQSVGNALSRGV